MSKLTRISTGSWLGYLWKWNSPIPERPGQLFKKADKTLLNVSHIMGSDLVGAKGQIFNIQKADEEGVFVVIASGENLTDYEIGYTLTSDNDIIDEFPYNAGTGETGYKLVKYPISSVYVKKAEADVSAAARPVTTSIQRPKRGGRSGNTQ